MTSWVESTLKDEDQRRSFNRESVKEEAAYGIYSLMESQGVSRAELARRIGRNRSFVTKVLGGSHNFTLETLADLYFAFGRYVHFTTGQDLTEVNNPGEEHGRGIPTKRFTWTAIAGSKDKIVQYQGFGEAEYGFAASVGRLHGSSVSGGSLLGHARFLCFDPASSRSSDTAGDSAYPDELAPYQVNY